MYMVLHTHPAIACRLVALGVNDTMKRPGMGSPAFLLPAATGFHTRDYQFP